MIAKAPIQASSELEADMGMGGTDLATADSGAWCHYSHSLEHSDPCDNLPTSLTRDERPSIILLGPSQPHDIEFTVNQQG